MWFKRDKKNRRLHRGHILDVKLRSDKVRATRARFSAIAVGVTFATFFGLYLLWRTGEWALTRFVYENSEFAVQKIDAQTDGVISPDQLRRWAGVKPGVNLIALDLASVKRNLQLVSTIDSVSVERVLPRTLKLRVTERKPIAEVTVPHIGPNGELTVSVLQLDTNGFVMQPLDPRLCIVPLSQITNQLPVIGGLNVFQLQPGHRIDFAQAQAAVKLINAFGHSPMSGLAKLRRVDVSSPQVVVATTEQGSEITFGLDNLEQQLRRWREIHDWGMSQNKIIVSLDLAVANNVPVRWADNNSAPITPKSFNPKNPRRKNV
jgi:cell division septal protein FtsQ